MYTSFIQGLGHFLPPREIDNAHLSQFMDTSDAWIQERTGIQTRRWVEKGDGWTSATMGHEAAKMAIEHAGISASEIDHIVFATISPDYYFPGNGVLVQEMLGLDTVGATDVRNACSGFVYALSIANAFIQTGQYKTVLVIGAELQSPVLDLSDVGRHVSVIFGDGAGAAVLGRAPEGHSGIQSVHLHAQGNHALELSMQGPSAIHWLNEIADTHGDPSIFAPHMNGNFIFKNAVVRFMEVIQEALAATGKSPSDIDCLVPHQANLRIAQYIQAKMGLRDDQVYNNIQRYGNTTGASIPIAFSEAVRDGSIQRGDTVCLAAFGAGFTWASALLTY
ncbi:MAG: ketoacyl-ACP synthase III [Flavobacteriia bacterium]|nr:ketoacyl-ACP synthase III [Flavobacteriia bacterium]